MEAFALVQETVARPYLDARAWLTSGQAPRAAELSGNRLERRRAAAAARARIQATDRVLKQRKVAARVGADLWAAANEADLADRLDALLDDPDVPRVTFGLMGFVQRAGFPGLQTFRAFAAAIVARTDDATLLAELEQGARVAQIVTNLFAEAGSRLSAERSPPLPPPPAASAWRLDTLPMAMLSPMLACLRASLCMAALVDLATSRRPAPSREIVHAVVRGWRLGQQEYLRVAAMFADTDDVPADLLPPGTRLHREAMVNDHIAAEADFQRFIELNRQ